MLATKRKPMTFKHLDYVTAYVDGSFYNGRYSGGYAIEDPDGRIIHTDCGIGSTNPELLAMRNISGEMTAAMRATQWIDSHVGRGIIVHDYNGLQYWVTGEWQTTKEYTRKYAEFMRPFYTLGIIKFNWVKGHTGVRGNELADTLAKEAIVFNRQWSS